VTRFFFKAPDGDDRSVGDEGEVDPGVGHQVRLELVQVHIQGPFKPGNMEHILRNLLSYEVIESFTYCPWLEPSIISGVLMI
jgi:hypothetical protein